MPQLIYAEDYLPEEELDVRYFPSYRSPDTVFLEEERIYSSLMALATIIRRDERVVKRAVYPEGTERLKGLIRNDKDLKEHGVPVTEAWLERDNYVMPYIHGETAIDYFRNLLAGDKEKFLAELDGFFELILNSSEHVSYEEVDWEHFDPDWKKRKADDPERDKWRKAAFGGPLI